MGKEPGNEVVLLETLPEDEWRDIIFEVVPQTLGISRKLIIERTQQLAEQLEQQPRTSVARAIFNLCNAGELRINEELVARVQASERQTG